MAGLRGLNKQLRIEQVLNAASELFATQGYEATHIEDIARAARVSPGTIYNYFLTKANILTALAVRHARQSLPARRALIRNPPDDPLAAVQAFEKLLADQALNTLGRECWRVIFAAPYSQPASRLHRAGIVFNRLILRHYVQMLAGFQDRGAIDAKVEIKELADLFTAIGTHHFGQFISSNAMTVEELKSAIEKHVSLIFSGLLSQSQKPARRNGTRAAVISLPRGVASKRKR
ncbi:TetR/AcrR family transcriptional regulator [Microvirga brassicacearum]|uniref:TetR/AcrR family transcriptional regulator n=1 Tax=Microvirga brassicacearum TaxID=2580413 RepID=UPI001391503A|nr:TetR/AcrR family transcriptional regulator [Microvirga brassicacearum]